MEFGDYHRAAGWGVFEILLSPGLHAYPAQWLVASLAGVGVVSGFSGTWESQSSEGIADEIIPISCAGIR